MRNNALKRSSAFQVILAFPPSLYPGKDPHLSPKNFSRREVLKIGGAIAAAELGGMVLHGCAAGSGNSIISSGSSACGGKLTDIEHVVILIQENRSFDHYFGSYRGVRGFADQSLAFQQPYSGNSSDPPVGVLLPFHLDTSTTNAACTHDITHDWVPQHQSWNSGMMNGFVNSRLPINANDAVLTMGYYTRADLPFYYAVADAFTICDNYFCPVMGPTDPNRLYSMAASIALVAKTADLYWKLWVQIVLPSLGP
jgi:phospholipase C